MTALKSLFFLIFVPGLLVGYIPFAFLLTGPLVDTGLLSLPTLPIWLVGGVMILWCFWDFLIKGKGTPAPFDPPRELVVTGLYNYVRNPMYVGVEMMLVGHYLWFGYWLLLGYAAFLFLAFHASILFYEEPTLKKKFGRSYENYLKTVPRWIPLLKRAGER
ncbi:MAG TPA: isoprenylcysteine carboxylmethyltransferase family protein [Anaerolineales bacterium]|nr:isoprenylcysteine carboxylmethyltransferase family protein [Anaerolineales bacterium]